MEVLTAAEQEIVERAAAEPMLEQVLDWAAVNSGSHNLDGLRAMADRLKRARIGVAIRSGGTSANRSAASRMPVPNEAGESSSTMTPFASLT